MFVKSRKWALAVVLAAVFIAVPAAQADTISGSGGAGWQNWTTGNLNENGYPYWDGNSWDGSSSNPPLHNIGFCLTATGNCLDLGASAPGTIPYWGNSNGSADPNFHLNATGPGDNAALVLEIAENAGNNVFGWYDTTDPSTLHVLFDGPAGSGATGTFTPSASYGFYIAGADGTWYTQSSLNPSGQTDDQHFAVFGDGSALWVGAEDLPLGSSDRDYNDMLVRVNPVPEPATLTLLGTGLVGIGMALKRRRAARKL